MSLHEGLMSTLWDTLYKGSKRDIMGISTGTQYPTSGHYMGSDDLTRRTAPNMVASMTPRDVPNTITTILQYIHTIPVCIHTYVPIPHIPYMPWDGVW